MALDVNDLALLKSMNGGSELTPYESVKLDHMAAKGHTGGVAIAGLVTGVTGLVAGATAWIFGGLFANAKGNQAREAAQSAKEISAAQYAAALQLMNSQNASTNQTLDRLIATVAAERAERIAGDVTLTQTVNDTQTGSQASQLTAAQQAELAASQATQQVMQQTFADAVTGKSSLNPTPVMIYSAPQPCACPGCGCNG